MPTTRRNLLAGLLGASAAGFGQSYQTSGQTIGFKSDNDPKRTECGIGALMPWADALWAITYNSHMKGTGDGLGLYRIGEDLRSELVHVHNGTHANRMIHHETNQCLIGQYVIDAKGNWKYIPEFDKHRLTSTMRHLKEPKSKVYYQTMEGLFFEMDLDTLKPVLLNDLAAEMNLKARPHFKGGYTAQQRVVVTNNGFYEYGETSAGLFEYDGAKWKRLSDKPHMDVAARENMGNVMFATGWDERSVLLHALVKGKWQNYRLPKASHAFEHAWQTEWMRIREVETEHFMMDIQGMFYELQPVAFEDHIWGVKPVCQHLRVIPDYCAFRGMLALGGNQTTPNADNNAVVGQPQSGLWFGKTDDLWSWGKPKGWGGVWRKTAIAAGVASDPFLMTGFDKTVLHLAADKTTTFDVQVDFLGNGSWNSFEKVKVSGYKPLIFPQGFTAHWARVISDTACVATAEFMYS